MSSPTSDMPSPTSDMPSPTGDMPSPTSQTPPVPPEVEPRKLVKISPIMVRLKPNPDADPPFGFCLDSESKICLIVGVVHCEMSIPEMEHLTTISCVEGVKTANAQKPEVYLESLIQHMGVPSFETGGGPRTKVFRKVLSTAVP
ncbi:hypothetical protein MMC18_008316 [Xylographa bjoerkii]|nr:hypothetical protein [Xylographa bjoerkii]